MTTKTDTFNYSQSPLAGGKWATITAAGLQSGASGANATTFSVQDCVSSWDPANYTFANDQTSVITFNTSNNGDWIGAGVRLLTTGGGQGYILYLRPEIPAAVLYGLIAGSTGVGSAQVLAGYAITIAAGTHTLELDVSGTTLTSIYDGVTLGTFTDSTFTSGQSGIAGEWGNTNGSLIATWTGTDAVVGGIRVPRLSLMGVG